MSTGGARLRTVSARAVLASANSSSELPSVAMHEQHRGLERDVGIDVRQRLGPRRVAITHRRELYLGLVEPTLAPQH